MNRAKPVRRRRRVRLGQRGGTVAWLAALALAALCVRSFVAAPRLVPSESMLPALLPGDLILVAKWSYGYSRHSLPLAPRLFDGRIMAAMPKRGDIVVYRPEGSTRDEVKRVIGLPGDVVELRGGRLHLNGGPVFRLRVADILLPVSANNGCHGSREGRECRYARYRETLRSGRDWIVTDTGDSRYDSMPPRRVPAGQLFLLGDNRDWSLDSRATGTIPVERLIGRPLVVLWSTDGSGDWLRPWTWWSAARGDRLGAPVG